MLFDYDVIWEVEESENVGGDPPKTEGRGAGEVATSDARWGRNDARVSFPMGKPLATHV